MSRGVALYGEQAIANARDHATTEQALIALVFGEAERARIRSAVKGRGLAVTFVDRIAALLEAVREESRPIAVIIVEVRDIDGVPTHQAVETLHASGSGAAVVGYCRAGAEFSTDIRSLVLAGAHQLLFHGIDDSGVALRAILEAAQQAAVGERAAAALTRLVPPRLTPFVSYVTRHPTTQRVPEVAEALGYHRKTLVNHCRQANLPPPHELLAWCRLAVAGELLARTPRTVEAIAHQLEFASATALRNMMKRYTGLRASDVRQRGGVRAVVDAFLGALHRQRGASARVG